jgi:cytochrome c-type biogenesis protein CcmH
MGWLVLVLIGAGAAALLWRLGLPRMLWSFAGAALMLGAAGYALQGRPMLPGQPTEASKVPGVVEPLMSELRLKMFGRFTFAEPYFVAADALQRSGAKGSAVSLLIGGIASAKQNAALWTALGQAYAAHDGTVSAPSRFAFDQAMRLAPEHPGPPFFLGVAYLDAEQFAETRKWWARAYRLSPPGASYRAEIGTRLRLLDRYLAEEGAGVAPAP